MTEDSGTRGLSRRQLIRGSAVGVASIYGAGVLAACGSGGGGGGGGTSSGSVGETSAGPPQGGTPVRGGTLRVGMIGEGETENIKIPLAITNVDLARVQSLYDPLFFVGDHGAVTPALVTEAHPNSDASVWTFHLRRGVVWHDGKPFNADDVVYTIQKSWGSPENSNNALLKGLIDFKNVRKVDEFTVQVPLLIPIAEFPSVTCGAPTYVIQAGTTDFDKPIGTGPFVYESFQAGSRSVFKANKNYWISGQPYIDELIIDTSFSDPNTVMNALLSGQIDVMPGAPAALAKANAEAGKIYMGNVKGPGWIAPLMRVDKAPFSDNRVRSALKLMSDREAIVQAAFDGFATVGNDCPGATLKYWASDLKAEHDPEKAKALLKEAGQEDLTVTLQTAPVLPGMNEMATIFAQQAKEAGATINIEQVELSQYYSASRYLKRSFGMEQWTAGINSLPIFYLSTLYPGAPYDETYWGQSKKFEKQNEVLRSALGEVDEAKAAEKWHAAQELQFNEGGMLLLANYNWLDGYGLNVRGMKTTNAGLCNNFTFTGAWLAT